MYKEFNIEAKRGLVVHGVNLVHFSAVSKAGDFVLSEGADDCSVRDAYQWMKKCVDQHWDVILRRCVCRCQKGVHECCDVCTGYLRAVATGKMRDHVESKRDVAKKRSNRRLAYFAQE